MTEEQIFQDALDLPDATARAAYLDRTCGVDSGLRQQVEALLANHFRSGEFLDVPAAEQLKAGSNNHKTITVQGDAVTAEKNPDDESDGFHFLTPSTRPDSLGRIGHYEVLQVLGKGGFGIVFRAFDDILQRVVAIKVMTPQLAATSPARKRFLREARTSAQVRHENVVQVYEVAEQPLPYLAMEFIPGETLQQRLDRMGPLDVPETLRIGRQIAEGLAAAHATDLIHRDIKPANVLIEGGPQQRVKITDFGLARAADDASISQSGIIAGTPMYMAPEQAQGQTLDQRADLFSLGSVLYQMAAGRAPFRANTTVAVLKRVAEDTPRSIREIIPETPQWLCDVIAKLHAKNPDDRYQSARDVADVLADCETQLKTHGEMRNFAGIPGGGKSPVKSKYRRLAMSLCGVAALFWAAILFGEPAYRYAANRSAIEVVPESGLTSISIHRDGQAVTDWYDAKTRPSITLPPGKYKLEPRFAPGRTVERWELRTRSTFSSRTEWQGVRAPEFEVARGEQVTVRAMMRDEPATTSIPPTGSDGFVPLFNGKDLTGWKPHNDLKGKWEVKDGAITCDGPVCDYLFSERGDYENIHLRVEAKVNAGGDSGVFFRCRPDPLVQYKKVAHPNLAGYEVQIAKFIENRTGSLWVFTDDLKPPYLTRQTELDLPPDEWFTLEVVARGRRLQVFLNSKKVADVENDQYSRGHIALQNLGEKAFIGKKTSVHFRKIEIKELPPTPKPLPPTFKNTLGMEFVVVPKGKSWLGGGKDKLGDQEVEIPADFYLGKYEVTQEEWEKVMAENPSHFSRNGERKDAVTDIPDADLKRFPVELVTWAQCQLFVAKLNKQEKETGWVYRLPTEVEWEYACRGGPMSVSDKLNSAFHFYFTKPTNNLLPEQANFNSGTEQNPIGGLNRTCKVGTYEPNGLGLCDMHGSVWEWCDDTLPKNDGASFGVYRGGSWKNSHLSCQAAARISNPQSDFGSLLGLRLARVPSGDRSPEVQTPPLAANVLKDAVLLMNFEKDSFYEKDGKTYVRDLSGNDNDGLCENVEFTTAGKAAGGLACKGGQLRLNKSLIMRQPNYTITLWGRADKIGANVLKERLYATARSELLDEIVFKISIPPERSVHVNAFNRAKPDKWVVANTKANVIPAGEWYFLAVTLSGGGVEQGELRVTVNGTMIRLSSQMVDSSLDGLVDMLGRAMTDCVLDEVAVFQRALTDQEIAAVRALGLKGTPFHVGKAPPVAKQEPLPPTFKNTIDMEFVKVPKGKSWLGGGKDKLGDKEVEIPADFYLGKYEVTQEEWEKVMGENPSQFSRTGKALDAVKDIADADLKRFPVETVSWDQCQLFVAKLNRLEKETGWVYRLPTAAEWEYACRGGPMSDKLDSAFDFYFAKPTNTLLPELANFAPAKGQGLQRTCRVGSYEPNLLGLFDMHGNVHEWGDDAKAAAAEGSHRIGLGGFWNGGSRVCSAANHSMQLASIRTLNLGLRLARVPSGAPSPESPPPLAIAPFTDTDVKRIAALPAAEQVEEVRKELKKRNPDFNGTLLPTIENDAVTGLVFSTVVVTDVAPVRALTHLKSLQMRGRVVKGNIEGSLQELSPLKGLPLTRLDLQDNPVWNLTPLKGMPLEHLNLWNWAGSELAPLKGMPLKSLNCGGQLQKIDLAPLAGLPLEFLCVNLTQVSDLSPIKDLPLTALLCSNTNVSDLTPLKGMRLQRLHMRSCKVSDLTPIQGMPLNNMEIDGTPVTDLTPIKDLPLKLLKCDFQAARDAKILRAIKTLEKINDKRVAEFWKDITDE